MDRSLVRRPAFVAAAIAASLVGFGAYLLYAPRSVPAGQPALVHLDEAGLDEFRERFNAAEGGTRLIVLLSPT